MPDIYQGHLVNYDAHSVSLNEWLYFFSVSLLLSQINSNKNVGVHYEIKCEHQKWDKHRKYEQRHQHQHDVLWLTDFANYYCLVAKLFLSICSCSCFHVSMFFYLPLIGICSVECKNMHICRKFLFFIFHTTKHAHKQSVHVWCVCSLYNTDNMHCSDITLLNNTHRYDRLSNGTLFTPMPFHTHSSHIKNVKINSYCVHTAQIMVSHDCISYLNVR